MREIKEFAANLDDVKAEGDKGEAVVKFATLNVVDKDDDVALTGAFGEQKSLVLYHHDRRQPPIGRADIWEKGDDAYARLFFNLKMAFGRDVFESIKMSDELQSYSYGYNLLKYKYGTFTAVGAQKDVRYLEEVDVVEISPVLVGAGIDTRTIDVKTANGNRTRMRQLDSELAIRERRATLLGV